MKIYISGPITNDPDFEKKFDYYRTLLRRRGHQVLDPTVWNREKLVLEYQEYMKLDLAMIEVCDAIYMLPNWQDSKGAQIELEYATRKGLQIFYADKPAEI